MSNKYLNYFLGSLLTLLVILTIYFGVFFYQFSFPLCRAELWIHKAQTIKRNLATSIPGQKLLIVGGSNGLFGVDSNLLETSLEIPTVNLSIHAGLGLQYMLDEAKMYAKPGDIILLLLEYELVGDNSKPSTIYLNHIVELDTAYFYSFSWLNQLKTGLAFGVPETFQGFWAKFHQQPNQKNCYEAIAANLEKRKGCYSGVTINAYGDEQCNLKELITEEVIKRLDSDTRAAKKWYLNSDTEAMLARFIKWTKENNIKLMAGFPSIVDMAAYHQKPTQAFLTSLTKFYQQQQVPVLGKPEDFMYDKSNFFDTYYHLHDVARKARTQRLIDLIAPFRANK